MNLTTRTKDGAFIDIFNKSFVNAGDAIQDSKVQELINIDDLEDASLDIVVLDFAELFNPDEFDLNSIPIKFDKFVNQKLMAAIKRTIRADGLVIMKALDQSQGNRENLAGFLLNNFQSVASLVFDCEQSEVFIASPSAAHGSLDATTKLRKFYRSFVS